MWIAGEINYVAEFKIETNLNAPGKSTAKTFKSYASIVGARYEVGTTSKTSYYGEIVASVSGGTKYSYASEIGAKRSFSGKAYFVAGYRYLAIKSGSGAEYAKISLSGSFVQLN